eukprot:scaffold1899_cov372-Prasinococcus_capsulatus_cf.AAC.1
MSTSSSLDSIFTLPTPAAGRKAEGAVGFALPRCCCAAWKVAGCWKTDTGECNWPGTGTAVAAEGGATISVMLYQRASSDATDTRSLLLRLKQFSGEALLVTRCEEQLPSSVLAQASGTRCSPNARRTRPTRAQVGGGLCCAASSARALLNTAAGVAMSCGSRRHDERRRRRRRRAQPRQRPLPAEPASDAAPALRGAAAGRARARRRADGYGAAAGPPPRSGPGAAPEECARAR